MNKQSDKPSLNPTLSVENVCNKGWVISWRLPFNDEERKKVASPEELLAIKIVSEDMSTEKAAQVGNTSVNKINHVLREADRKGIIFLPSCGLRRRSQIFNPEGKVDEKYILADTFTIQWHITNACDLNCKHCYDRTKKSPLIIEQGKNILDKLKAFCSKHYIKGHVCFTGGNPFMYPGFFDLYQETADRGFSTSVLGNPMPKKQIERLISIQKPGYYQVSLEGLEEHTDFIRGKGHFKRAVDFLRILKELNVSSAVMLTLTDQNIDQIIPLAKFLKGKTDHFTFNRISLVGQGAKLRLPSKRKYEDFLEDYVEEFKDSNYAGYKDNLINIILGQKKLKPFSGCTGFGCGAAFNFVAILPDGEVHACRKFPSPIGNIIVSDLSEIYDSDQAERYRQGSESCLGCRLRSICGGCLAITHSCGKDIFKDRDPYCFLNPVNQLYDNS